ncbi:MAG: hypothetical protein P9L94_10790 [Candidatus Hinthialibacter antarcticus]|nr:hypothetical protein [Candidatus Hinthialibacter antarcticus]
MFQPFRLEYWLKGALLVFFAQGYQGPKPNFTPWLQENMQSGDFYATLLQQLPLIIAGGLLLLVLGTVYMFIGSCISFMLMDGVKQGVFHLRQSFKNNISSIISLFLWNLIAGITIVLCVVLVGGVVAAPFIFISQGSSSTALMVIMVLLLLLVCLIVFVAFVIYSAMLAGLVVPQMLVEKKGIFAAWSTAIGLVLSNLMEFLGYIVIQVGLALVFGFVVFVFYMLFSMFALAIVAAMGGIENFPETMTTLQNSGLMMPLGAFVALFMLPVPVLLQSYTLHFVAALTGNESYSPSGRQAPSPQTPPAPTESSTPPSSPTPQSSPTPPSPSGTSDPQPPMNGPVNFSDIPTQSANTTSPSETTTSPSMDNITLEPPQSGNTDQPLENDGRKE